MSQIASFAIAAFILHPAAVAQSDEKRPSLSAITSGLRSGKLLKGLKVEFKSFDNKQATTSAGLAYEYDRDFDLFGLGDDLRIGVLARGNVAFDATVNPNDFLESKIQLTFHRDWGGVYSAAGRTDQEKRNWAETRRQLATVEDQDELDELFFSSEEVYENAFAFLSPQLSLDGQIDAGLESNQDFTARQTTFGADARLELNLWGDSAAYNLFDYPFAFVRYLAGEGSWRVLGSTVPHVTVGVDLVSPEENDPRATAGDTSDYLRLNAEVGFRTLLLERKTSDIFFSAHWRTYHELDASDSVRAADLETYDYFRATISSGEGLFMSYTTGRLPLGVRDADAYEVGWAFKF